jgi:hypothetical protein
MADDETPEAPARHFVQVQYPHPADVRWITVAVADYRPAAAKLAARAYGELLNPLDRRPMGVRILTEAELRARGGAEAVDRAYRDLEDVR